MARGRLINPVVAELARQDTIAITAASGFDADFKEPVKITPVSAQGPGTTVRTETLLRLPCQVEMGRHDLLVMAFTGAVPVSSLTCIFHFRDIERSGMLATNGEPTIHTGTRLVAFYNQRTGKKIQDVDRPMFSVEVMPQSFGLSGGTRNLLEVRFEQRDTGLRHTRDTGV